MGTQFINMKYRIIERFRNLYQVETLLTNEWFARWKPVPSLYSTVQEAEEAISVLQYAEHLPRIVKEI